MKKLLLTLGVLVAMAIRAATPSFSDFNSSQFGTAGNRVYLTNGAMVTNIVTTGLRMTNRFSAAGFLYIFDPVSGWVDQIVPGTGVNLNGGFLNGDWQTLAGNTTNNNTLISGGMGFTTSPEYSLPTVTTNIVSLDMSGNGPPTIRWILTNSGTLTFTGINAATNAAVSVLVCVTNVGTNTLLVDYQSNGEWLPQQNPFLVGNKWSFFRFTAFAGRVLGNPEGTPKLAPNEFVSQNWTAASATTNFVWDFGNGGNTISSGTDIFVTNSTNRLASFGYTALSKTAYIRASATIKLYPQASWVLSGTTVNPWTITNGTGAIISVLNYGPSETNCVAGITYTQ